MRLVTLTALSVIHFNCRLHFETTHNATDIATSQCATPLPRLHYYCPVSPSKHLSAAIRWTTCATKVFTLYVADSGGSYSTHVPKSTTGYNNAMVWLHFPFERPFRDQFNWHIPHSIAGKYMCGQKEEAGTSKWLAEISIHSLKLNNTFSLHRCSFTFKYEIFHLLDLVFVGA